MRRVWWALLAAVCSSVGWCYDLPTLSCSLSGSKLSVASSRCFKQINTATSATPLTAGTVHCSTIASGRSVLVRNLADTAALYSGMYDTSGTIRICANAHFGELARAASPPFVTSRSLNWFYPASWGGVVSDGFRYAGQALWRPAEPNNDGNGVPGENCMIDFQTDVIVGLNDAGCGGTSLTCSWCEYPATVNNGAIAQANVTNKPPVWLQPPQPIDATGNRSATATVTVGLTVANTTLAGAVVTEFYADDPDPLWLPEGQVRYTHAFANGTLLPWAATDLSGATITLPAATAYSTQKPPYTLTNHTAATRVPGTPFAILPWPGRIYLAVDAAAYVAQTLAQNPQHPLAWTVNVTALDAAGARSLSTRVFVISIAGPGSADTLYASRFPQGISGATVGICPPGWVGPVEGLRGGVCFGVVTGASGASGTADALAATMYAKIANGLSQCASVNSVYGTTSQPATFATWQEFAAAQQALTNYAATIGPNTVVSAWTGLSRYAAPTVPAPADASFTHTIMWANSLGFVGQPKIWAQPDSQGSFFTPCQPNGCPAGAIMSASCTVLTNAPAVVGAAGVPLVHPQNCTATTNNAWHAGRKFAYLCEMYAYTGGTVTVPNVPPYFLSYANTTLFVPNNAANGLILYRGTGLFADDDDAATPAGTVAVVPESALTPIMTAYTAPGTVSLCAGIAAWTTATAVLAANSAGFPPAWVNGSADIPACPIRFVAIDGLGARSQAVTVIIQPQIQTVVVATGAPFCPTGWTLGDPAFNYCFKFFTNMTMGIEEGQARCAAQPTLAINSTVAPTSYLASFRSYREFVALQSLGNANGWRPGIPPPWRNFIGLTGTSPMHNQTDGWRWMNPSASIDYLRSNSSVWSPGEPNLYNGWPEYCSHFTLTNLINDVNCTLVGNFTCEQPAWYSLVTARNSPPVLASPTAVQFTVYDSMPVGTVLLQLYASDPDPPGLPFGAASSFVPTVGSVLSRVPVGVAVQRDAFVGTTYQLCGRAVTLDQSTGVVAVDMPSLLHGTSADWNATCTFTVAAMDGGGLLSTGRVALRFNIIGPSRAVPGVQCRAGWTAWSRPGASPLCVAMVQQLPTSLTAAATASTCLVADAEAGLLRFGSWQALQTGLISLYANSVTMRPYARRFFTGMQVAISTGARPPGAAPQFIAGGAAWSAAVVGNITYNASWSATPSTATDAADAFMLDLAGGGQRYWGPAPPVLPDAVRQAAAAGRSVTMQGCVAYDGISSLVILNCTTRLSNALVACAMHTSGTTAVYVVNTGARITVAPASNFTGLQQLPTIAASPRLNVSVIDARGTVLLPLTAADGYSLARSPLFSNITIATSGSIVGAVAVAPSSGALIVATNFMTSAQPALVPTCNASCPAAAVDFETMRVAVVATDSDRVPANTSALSFTLAVGRTYATSQYPRICPAGAVLSEASWQCFFVVSVDDAGARGYDAWASGVASCSVLWLPGAVLAEPRTQQDLYAIGLAAAARDNMWAATKGSVSTPGTSWDYQRIDATWGTSASFPYISGSFNGDLATLAAATDPTTQLLPPSMFTWASGDRVTGIDVYNVNDLTGSAGAGRLCLTAVPTSPMGTAVNSTLLYFGYATAARVAASSCGLPRSAVCMKPATPDPRDVRMNTSPTIAARAPTAGADARVAVSFTPAGNTALPASCRCFATVNITMNSTTFLRLAPGAPLAEVTAMDIDPPTVPAGQTSFVGYNASGAPLQWSLGTCNLVSAAACLDPADGVIRVPSTPMAARNAAVVGASAALQTEFFVVATDGSSGRSQPLRVVFQVLVQNVAPTMWPLVSTGVLPAFDWSFVAGNTTDTLQLNLNTTHLMGLPDGTVLLQIARDDGDGADTIQGQLVLNMHDRSNASLVVPATGIVALGNAQFLFLDLATGRLVFNGAAALQHLRTVRRGIVAGDVVSVVDGLGARSRPLSLAAAIDYTNSVPTLAVVPLSLLPQLPLAPMLTTAAGNTSALSGTVASFPSVTVSINTSHILQLRSGDVLAQLQAQDMDDPSTLAGKVDVRLRDVTTNNQLAAGGTLTGPSVCVQALIPALACFNPTDGTLRFAPSDGFSQLMLAEGTIVGAGIVGPVDGLDAAPTTPWLLRLSFTAANLASVSAITAVGPAPSNGSFLVQPSSPLCGVGVTTPRLVLADTETDAKLNVSVSTQPSPGEIVFVDCVPSSNSGSALVVSPTRVRLTAASYSALTAVYPILGAAPLTTGVLDAAIVCTARSDISQAAAGVVPVIADTQSVTVPVSIAQSNLPLFEDAVLELDAVRLRSSWLPIAIANWSDSGFSSWDGDQHTMSELAARALSPPAPARMIAQRYSGVAVSTRANVTLVAASGLAGGDFRFAPLVNVTVGGVPVPFVTFDSQDGPWMVRLQLPSFSEMCGDDLTALPPSGSCGAKALTLTTSGAAAADVAFLCSVPAPLPWASLLPRAAANISCPPFCPDVLRAAGSWNGTTFAALKAASPTGSSVDSWNIVSAPGGFTYVVKCSDPKYTDPATGFCSDPSNPASRQCAFGYGDKCADCPTQGLCPGGLRFQPFPGFFVPAETSVSVVACASPSKERCVGWNAALAAVECGEGYRQGSPGCSACATGYYPTTQGACVKCAAGIDDPMKILQPVLLFFAGMVGVAVAMFGVIVAITKRYGVLNAANMKHGAQRAVQFALSTFTTLQTLAQIGRSSSAGLPSFMREFYSSINAMNFQFDGVNAACIGGGPESYFRFEEALFTTVLILVGTYATVYFAYSRSWRLCRRADPSSTKTTYISLIARFSAVGLGLVYPTVTNAALGVMYTLPADVPVRVYAQLSGDGTALAAVGIANTPEAIDANADTLLHIRVLARDTSIVAYEWPHRRAAALAWLAFLLFTVAWPVFTFFWIWDRIRTASADIVVMPTRTSSVVTIKPSLDDSAAAMHSNPMAAARAAKAAGGTKGSATSGASAQPANAPISAKTAAEFAPVSVGVKATAGGAGKAATRPRPQLSRSHSKTAMVLAAPKQQQEQPAPDAKPASQAARKMIARSHSKTALLLGAPAASAAPQESSTPIPAAAAKALSKQKKTPLSRYSQRSQRALAAVNDATTNVLCRCCVRDPRIEKLEDDPSSVLDSETQPFLGGDYRLSAFFIRHWDIFVLFVLSVIATLSANPRALSGSVAGFLTTAVMLLITAVLVVRTQPFKASVRFNYYVSTVSTIVAFLSALLNVAVIVAVGAVVDEDLDDSELPPSVLGLAYLTFLCSIVLLVVLLVSFIAMLIDGARQDAIVTKEAAAEAAAATAAAAAAVEQKRRKSRRESLGSRVGFDAQQSRSSRNLVVARSSSSGKPASRGTLADTSKLAAAAAAATGGGSSTRSFATSAPASPPMHPLGSTSSGRLNPMFAAASDRDDDDEPAFTRPPASAAMMASFELDAAPALIAYKRRPAPAAASASP